MPVLLGQPHLFLREALQLIATTDKITNKINKARFKFFIKDDCLVKKIKLKLTSYQLSHLLLNFIRPN